jgi:glycosyltransferase involved in cell wall biosynthesis
MGKRLKIAFITATDARDKINRSGTPYFMAKSLEKHCGDVYYLGPLTTRMEKVTRFFNNLSLKLFKKGYAYEHSILLSFAYARIIRNKLKDESFDVIFAPVASTELSLLTTDVPIIYTADATFSLISDYYPDYFSGQLKISWEEGNYIEQSAILKADLLLYPSKWAANSAINDYGARESIVNVIAYGANIDDYPTKEIILDKKKTDKCQLLFLGVDWVRKGGEIAFETLLELIKLGINAELTVCGCIPPDEFKHERMTVIPYLDKNDEVQSQKLQELFLKSDFLLLPSRTEAYGVVFCEANAFGLPAITTDTGGISGVIEEGVNGFMLPLSAGGKEYANIIQKVYEDEEMYYQLIKSSRETFEEKLNWDSWGKKTKTLINQLIK